MQRRLGVGGRVAALTCAFCLTACPTPPPGVPTLSSVTPATVLVGAGATRILVDGAGFTASSVVSFGAQPLATSLFTASELEATVPAALLASAGTVPITVSTPAPGGGTSSALDFQILYPSPANVRASPSKVVAGSPDVVVAVNGTGFVPASALSLGALALSTHFVSATQMTAVVPAAALASPAGGTLTVSTPGPGGGQAQAKFDVVTPGGRYRSANVGAWAYFDERSSPSGYFPGQLIQNWNTFDPAVGSLVSDEVSLQLDVMRSLGINLISFDLRTADNVGPSTLFEFPACSISPATGFQYPQPTATELANLPLLLDLLQSKGMSLHLILNNNHMEEATTAHWQTWLGAILGIAGTHPAVSLIMFGGNQHTVDTNNDGVPDSCGLPVEPPLYQGPGLAVYNYVQWAIGYALSLGVPAEKLSAECVVSALSVDQEQPSSAPLNEIAGGHLWYTVRMLKSIFDSLSIPENKRV